MVLCVVLCGMILTLFFFLLSLSLSQRRQGKEAAKGTTMDTVTDTVTDTEMDTEMDTDAALQKAIDDKFAAIENRGSGDEEKGEKGEKGERGGQGEGRTERKLSNTKMKILGFNPRKKGGNNGADRNGALGELTAQTRRLALDQKGFINVLKTHKLFGNAAALPTAQV